MSHDGNASRPGGVPKEPPQVHSRHFDEWLEVFPCQFQDAADDPAELADLVMSLESVLAHRHLGAWKTWAERLRTRLGYTPERFALLLDLETPEDVRRAIRATQLKPHLRMGDEKLYPTSGWLGRYLQLAQGSEVPLGWHFWSGVCAMAACLKRNFSVDRGSYWVFPNHYVMLLGDSGMRKGGAFGPAIKVVNHANRLLREQGEAVAADLTVPTHVGRGSVQELIETIKIRTETHLDVETGKIYDPCRATSCAFVANEEAVNLLGASSGMAAAWVEVLTALYTCPDHWDYRTRGHGIEELRQCALTCLFASAATWLRDACHEAVLEGGFVGRFVFVHRIDSNRDYAWPDPVDPIESRLLARYLVELARKPNQEMRLTDGAKEWFKDWYLLEHRPSQPPAVEMTSYWERRHDHVWKLAIVLALSDERGTIDWQDLELAQKLLALEEQRLPRVFGELTQVDQSKLGDYVFKVIANKGGRITRTELSRKVLKRVGTTKELNDIMESLDEQRLVRKLFDMERRMTVYQIVHDPYTED